MAVDEANATAGKTYWDFKDALPSWLPGTALYALALRIERTEGPFEDPDLVDARGILAQAYEEDGSSITAADARSGLMDTSAPMIATLAGIKHGRKQS
jgi:hypothetical protein